MHLQGLGGNVGQVTVVCFVGDLAESGLFTQLEGCYTRSVIFPVLYTSPFRFCLRVGIRWGVGAGGRTFHVTLIYIEKSDV